MNQKKPEEIFIVRCRFHYD